MKTKTRTLGSSIVNRVRSRVNRDLGRPSWASPTFWDVLTWFFLRHSSSTRGPANPLPVLLALGMGISVAQALAWRF